MNPNMIYTISSLVTLFCMTVWFSANRVNFEPANRSMEKQKVFISLTNLKEMEDFWGDLREVNKIKNCKERRAWDQELERRKRKHAKRS